MAYFAEIDGNNVVKRVIVADQSFIDSGAVGEPSNWVETDPGGAFRKHYAGIGFTYDKTMDAFVPPKPYPSWSLNEQTASWEAPLPIPTEQPAGRGDSGGSMAESWTYIWDEDIGDWKYIEFY